MREFFFLVVFMVAIHGLPAQEAAVFAAETARFQAQTKRDAAALDALLHEELYYLHSNGLIESKKDFINSVRGGKIVYASMEATDRRLRVYGKTAVLTGLVTVSGQYQGKEFELGLYYTSVYRKRRGRWQLVNWQSTGKSD